LRNRVGRLTGRSRLGGKNGRTVELQTLWPCENVESGSVAGLGSAGKTTRSVILGTRKSS